jgi:hypothetical protein
MGERDIMGYRILVLLVALLVVAFPGYGQDVSWLAECGLKTFREINRSGKWSGKQSPGCRVNTSVERRSSGIFVTTWVIDDAEGGWVRTSFSAAMGQAEISGKSSLARAGRDILARARRLQRCLNSIVSVNDPLECRDYATKSTIVDEESGTENRRLVWLDDDGRHTVVEYTFGNTSATPTPPVDLFSGPYLPPGVTIDLNVRQPHGTRP